MPFLLVVASPMLESSSLLVSRSQVAALKDRIAQLEALFAKSLMASQGAGSLGTLAEPSTTAVAGIPLRQITADYFSTVPRPPVRPIGGSVASCIRGLTR